MSFIKQLILTLLVLSLTLLSLASCNQSPATSPNATDTPETSGAAPSETKDETPTSTDAPKNSVFKVVEKPSDTKFEKLFQAPTTSKRQAVYDAMMAMATIEWTPTVDFTTTSRPEIDKSFTIDLEYKAGKTYYGVPYGETKANLYQFQDFLTDGKFSCDSYYYQDIIGNHCSSCMFLAYQQIIPVGYGTFRPTVARQGIFKLAGNLQNPGDGTWYSKDVFALNGQEAVYEAYTTLDMGDIVFKCISGSGHTRFVSKVEITKSAAGKLIPSRSYVYCIENTNTWYDSNKNSTWWIDKKYTFGQLWETEFMPITLDTYFDDTDKVQDAYIWFTGANTPEKITTKLAGKVVSNFPLNYVRVTIEDKDGNLVKEAFKRNMNEVFEVDVYRECFSLKLNELPTGTYKYTLKAAITRGGCEIESFEFTVK